MKVARPEGFEPSTNRVETDYSIQLSYERIYVEQVRRIELLSLAWKAKAQPLYQTC